MRMSSCLFECQASRYCSYASSLILPGHIRLIPWRPAVNGLAGYKNGMRSWYGLVAIGIVGKS
jgi:hypothetical protein